MQDDLARLVITAFVVVKVTSLLVGLTKLVASTITPLSLLHTLIQHWYKNVLPPHRGKKNANFLQTGVISTDCSYSNAA